MKLFLRVIVLFWLIFAAQFVVAYYVTLYEASSVEVLEQLFGKPYKAFALCVVKVCSYHF